MANYVYTVYTTFPEKPAYTLLQSSASSGVCAARKRGVGGGEEGGRNTTLARCVCVARPPPLQQLPLFGQNGREGWQKRGRLFRVYSGGRGGGTLPRRLSSVSPPPRARCNATAAAALPPALSLTLLSSPQLSVSGVSLSATCVKAVSRTRFVQKKIRARKPHVSVRSLYNIPQLGIDRPAYIYPLSSRMSPPPPPRCCHQVYNTPSYTFFL